MRLYLIRHPPPIVAPGVCYGASDLAVMPREHARVAAALHDALPKGTLLFFSPLRRCAELAHTLKRQLNCSAARADARLVEMDFGDWELRDWNDIARAEIDAWSANLLTYRPGGGETVLEMAQRVQAFHHELSVLPCDEAIVVCHAGTIRMLLACRHRLPLVDLAQSAAQSSVKIGYGEMMVVEY